MKLTDPDRCDDTLRGNTPRAPPGGCITRLMLIRPLETVTKRSFHVLSSPTFCFKYPCLNPTICGSGISPPPPPSPPPRPPPSADPRSREIRPPAPVPSKTPLPPAAVGASNGPGPIDRLRGELAEAPADAPAVEAAPAAPTGGGCGGTVCGDLERGSLRSCLMRARPRDVMPVVS